MRSAIALGLGALPARKHGLVDNVGWSQCAKSSRSSARCSALMRTRRGAPVRGGAVRFRSSETRSRTSSSVGSNRKARACSCIRTSRAASVESLASSSALASSTAASKKLRSERRMSPTEMSGRAGGGGSSSGDLWRMSLRNNWSSESCVAAGARLHPRSCKSTWLHRLSPSSAAKLRGRLAPRDKSLGGAAECDDADVQPPMPPAGDATAAALRAVLSVQLGAAASVALAAPCEDCAVRGGGGVAASSRRSAPSCECSAENSSTSAGVSAVGASLRRARPTILKPPQRASCSRIGARRSSSRSSRSSAPAPPSSDWRCDCRSDCV